MKILSYNTAMYFPDFADAHRALNIRHHLISDNYDIVGLCEVYNPVLRKLLLENSKMKKAFPFQKFYPSTYFGMDNGTVILSKYPIRRTQRYEYKNWKQIPLNYLLPPKDILFSEIDINGSHLGVFVTHLQWGVGKQHRMTRRRQMRELRSFIESVWDINQPTLLMGDFNTFIKHNEVKYLLKIFPEFNDWVASNLDENKPYTWSSKNRRTLLYITEERFDLILANNLVQPKQVQIKEFQGHYISKKQTITIIQESDIEITTKIWFFVSRLKTILFFPLRAPLYLFLYLTRALIRGEIDDMSRLDLSDHFSIAAEAQFLSS